MRERVSSGIKGFDELIAGGFLKGSLVFLVGHPGAGKTTFCGKFLYDGLERGEKCVYVTFMEPREELLEFFSGFGWDFYTHERMNSFRILDLSIGEEREIEDVTSQIMDETRKMKAERLVIDSLSAMLLGITEAVRKREFIRILHRVIYKLETTTLCTVELTIGEERIGHGGEEFIADGLIFLRSEYIGDEMVRKLSIVKMRGTDHTKGIHRYKLTDRGFELFEFAP